MRRHLRRGLLAGALLVTLALCAWVTLRPPGPTAAVAASARGVRELATGATDLPAPTANDPMTPTPTPAAPRLPTASDHAVDVFKVVTFLPPPPPPAAPLPPPTPPAPVAPRFPYTYFGRLTDGAGRVNTFLSRADELLEIHQGEVLQGAYRVDTIADNQITITYLPLNEKAVITLPAATN